MHNVFSRCGEISSGAFFVGVSRVIEEEGEITSCIIGVPHKLFATPYIVVGIPPLLQNISLSPPSVPKAEDHAPVEVGEMNFGTGYVSYASENDVALLVSGLVKDISRAMGIDIETFTEIGAFGLRSDVWFVTWNMIPVGVIEVKKREEYESCFDCKSVLDKPTVLGELYDFLMQLPNFYGERPAFGILTTFDCWRACWIPEADVDVDSIAETTESLPKSEA
eukprot:scaffold42123_cov221-Amphora_coffeaeformis.AAC.2